MANVQIQLEFDTDEIEAASLTALLDELARHAPDDVMFGLWVDGEQRDPDDPGELLW